MQRARYPTLCLGLLLIIGLSASALANPNDYPEFANQRVAADIRVTFISPGEVKHGMDTGAAQTLIDVRKKDGYNQAHLPGAVSLPLRQLADRLSEVPRNIDVVLY